MYFSDEIEVLGETGDMDQIGNMDISGEGETNNNYKFPENNKDIGDDSEDVYSKVFEGSGSDLGSSKFSNIPKPAVRRRRKKERDENNCLYGKCPNNNISGKGKIVL